MQKLVHFWKSYKKLLNIFVLIIGLFVVFNPLSNDKFYGFEYEDSFISSHVASQSNLKQYVDKFRTQGCESLVNGECLSTASYTGHYVTYSLYLFSIDSIVGIDKPFLIHKIGNGILIGMCFIFTFVFYKKQLIGTTLMMCLISCLPVVYVLNSSLIENLSFSLGLFYFFSLNEYKVNQKKLWLMISLILISLLVIVKRENLIYLPTLLILDYKTLYKNYAFWILMLALISSQILINPFFTEGLEASYLERSTFSFEYFKFQFPTYLYSFFRVDGFIVLVVFVLLIIQPTKSSLISLSIWIAFILLYSFHYRGQYAIEAGEITHFESFRYMFNTLPVFLGYFIFGTLRKPLWNKTVSYAALAFCIYSISNNTNMLMEFGREEYTEYHRVNEKINLLADEKSNLSIHDNFVLISMLNLKENDSIDVFSANENSINFKEKETNILINRFDIIDLKKFENTYKFYKIDSLSSKGTDVYHFDKLNR
jgi:hypothetical protein